MNAIEYLNRGNANDLLGRHAEAIADFDRAIALYPDNNINKANCYFNRGNANDALGRYEEAIADFNHAIALYPDNNINKAHCYFNRGNANYALGRHAEAITDFNRAIALYPDNNINKADCYFNRGNANYALGRHAEAITDFNHAIALYPDNNINKADCYLNRGNANYVLGSHEEAIADFDRAIHLNPTIAAKFATEQLKDFFTNHFAFYHGSLKQALSNRQRLSACYEGEVDETLTDRNGHYLLMNKPVLLVCCSSTFDLETLQALQNKVCPCCRAPIGQEYFLHPVVNRFAEKIIDGYVTAKEESARAAQLEKLANAPHLISNASLSVHEEKEEQPGQPSVEEQLLLPQSADVSSSSSAAALGSRTLSAANPSPSRDAVSRKAFLAEVEAKARQARAAGRQALESLEGESMAGLISSARRKVI